MPSTDGRDLRPGRLVALTVRNAPRHDGRGPVDLDAHRPVLATATAHLDVAAESDPELHAITTRPPRRLLGAPIVVVAAREGRVERARVFAGVVRRTRRRLVRKRVGRDEVAAAHVDHVEVEHVREHVDRAFQQRGRFGTSGAAVRTRRRRVREHDARVELDLRDPVGARGHEPRDHRDERTADRIGTDVRDPSDPEPDDRAVAPRPDLHVVGLTAAVGHVQEVLVPRLAPRDRPTESLRQRPRPATVRRTRRPSRRSRRPRPARAPRPGSHRARARRRSRVVRRRPTACSPTRRSGHPRGRRRSRSAPSARARPDG